MDVICYGLRVGILGWILLVWGGAIAVAETPRPADEILEAILRRAGIGSDNSRLLAYLRQREKTDQDLKQIEALIRKLGSKGFAQPKQAGSALVTLGLPGPEKGTARKRTRKRGHSSFYQMMNVPFSGLGS